MRWFTCTPKNFLGSQIFFDRDSGLMSRGLKSIGLEGRPIMLGPARDGDWPELIRATRGELEDPAWWHSHDIDGVVFYSWAGTGYQRIANAIVRAGISLVQVSDTHGIVSPLSEWKAHCNAAWHHHWQENLAQKLVRTLLKLPYSHTIGILHHDLPMARMITAGDFFLAATPEAARRYRKLVQTLLGSAAAKKVRMLPLPVNFHFRMDPSVIKEDEVVAVGRWDHPQKRASLLMETIHLAASERESTRFRIFGAIPHEMITWHAALPTGIRSRVTLEGKVTNQQLAAAYQQARVMLVSAAYEGCHNASAEAVCCGCTVVAANSPFMAALEWHASKNSGTLSKNASSRSLTESLLAELDTWDRGDRHPEIFAPQWAEIFHPDRVALNILHLFGIQPPHLP
jgi:hypothetical protein